MKSKNEILDFIIEIAATLFNMVWFGAWLYIIFGLHNSGYWILVPVLFHASTKEIK